MYWPLNPFSDLALNKENKKIKIIINALKMNNVMVVL